MYGGKFAFQNRLGQLVVGRKFTIFALFYFVFDGKFQVQGPRGAYIRRGDLTEGVLRYEFGGLIYLEGLIHGGAYFRNFTVSSCILVIKCEKRIQVIRTHQRSEYWQKLRNPLVLYHKQNDPFELKIYKDISIQLSQYMKADESEKLRRVDNSQLV